jgi:cob(I)alamin adenosyltransferase
MQADKFNKTMATQKSNVDAAIDKANIEQSVVVLLTGDGKGKTTSGFGTIFRALGYGQNVAVVQFIKGVQASGEELLLKHSYPQVPLIQMGTGFTWDTQNFDADKAAAQRTWAEAARLLQDPALDVLLLDELTYMLAYKFLDEETVLAVSEVKNLKHAFEAGVKARRGVDY